METDPLAAGHEALGWSQERAGSVEGGAMMPTATPTLSIVYVWRREAARPTRYGVTRAWPRAWGWR